MGKKSAKGKEKKLKRLEENKKQSESYKVVQEANSVANPFIDLKAFHFYRRNGLNISLSCYKINDLDESQFEATFKLIEVNMKALYENSNWGWKEKDKREELKEENARYLLATNEENDIVAASHFRFDIDEGIEVLYCYEIQLMKDIRGNGLGKFMMQILELMALKAKMKKVMLTVFKGMSLCSDRRFSGPSTQKFTYLANNDAISFFTNMKYTIDETSPQYYDPLHLEDYDYEIMSKTFQPK